MEQDRRWNWPKLFYQMWQNCPDWQTPFSSSPHFLECIPKTWTFARIWRCTQYILSVRHCQDISELLKQRCLWVTDTNQKWGLFHPSYKIKAMMLPHLTSINFLKELVERVMKEKGIFLWWLFYKFSQSFLSIMYWLLLGENDLRWLQ